MAVAVITGAAGLVGSACARLLAEQGFEVAGIDNDLRGYFFGPGASTVPTRLHLERDLPSYRHHDVDIRDRAAMEAIFLRYGRAVRVVVHTAAQPSHEWAVREPETDFAVNAAATLQLLELVRTHCPESTFVFTSTNKVYGDTPNRLPLVEQAERWEIEASHPFARHGIDESMSIDRTRHTIFGSSKLAADVLVQEYGSCFGLTTGVFRAGCLTGPGHAAAELHGFLAYLVHCAVTGTPYRVLGHQGKQVRDNMHARDLARAMWEFMQAPRAGEVYNIGGSRHSHCSLREAVTIIEEVLGRRLAWEYVDRPRHGDHVWWVSDVRKFRGHYPGFEYEYGIRGILEELCDVHGTGRSEG